jgi:hypothetical protein
MNKWRSKKKGGKITHFQVKNRCFYRGGKSTPFIKSPEQTLNHYQNTKSKSEKLSIKKAAVQTANRAKNNGNLIEEQKWREIIEKMSYDSSKKVRLPWDRSVVTIDSEMVPIVKVLWEKGWRTSECCSSHLYDIGKTPPYIFLSSVQTNKNPKFVKDLAKYINKNSTNWNLENKWQMDNTGFLTLKGKEGYHYEGSIERHKTILSDLQKIVTKVPNYPNGDKIGGKKTIKINNNYNYDKDLIKYHLKFLGETEKKRTRLVMMSPSTFLKQCPTPEIFKNDQKYKNANDCPIDRGYNKEKIDFYKAKLLRKEPLDVLELDNTRKKQINSKWAGHDGRHRAKAAHLLTIKRIPVLVTDWKNPT